MDVLAAHTSSTGDNIEKAQLKRTFTKEGSIPFTRSSLFVVQKDCW
jgi:hypothetical protein